MDLYDVIAKRRAIRSYQGKASEAQLRKIILAGTKAPSARNRQPWEFVIVEDQRLVDRLADLKYQLNGKVDPDQKEKQTLDARERGALDQKRSFDKASIVAFCNEVDWERSVWLCIPEGYGLTAVLKIGKPAEEGFPRDKNPFAPRRQEFSWLHRNRFRAAGA